MKHRWSFYRKRHGCRCWTGVQDVPLAQHEQKQSTDLFAAQGLASPYEK